MSEKSLKEHLDEARAKRWATKSPEERAAFSKMMNDKQYNDKRANKKNSDS